MWLVSKQIYSVRASRGLNIPLMTAVLSAEPFVPLSNLAHTHHVPVRLSL